MISSRSERRAHGKSKKEDEILENTISTVCNLEKNIHFAKTYKVLIVCELFPRNSTYKPGKINLRRYVGKMTKKKFLVRHVCVESMWDDLIQINRKIEEDIILEKKESFRKFKRCVTVANLEMRVPKRKKRRRTAIGTKTEKDSRPDSGRGFTLTITSSSGETRTFCENEHQKKKSRKFKEWMRVLMRNKEEQKPGMVFISPLSGKICFSCMGINISKMRKYFERVKI